MDWNQIVIIATTGVIAVGGTLTGTYMSNRHQAKQAAIDRNEQRLNGLREAIADLIVNCRDFQQQQESLVMIFASLKKRADFLAFTETETATRIGDCRARVDASIARARLLAGKSDLGKRLHELDGLWRGFPEHGTGPALQAGSGELPVEEGIQRSNRYLIRFMDAVGKVEELAQSILSASVDVDHS